MTATPDDELTEQGILRRARLEQWRADYLKRRGFLDAAIMRSEEVKELVEIALIKDVPERTRRLQRLYRQRDIKKRRDPLFASSYAVKGWKAHRTAQENRFLRAKSASEKVDAESQLMKYALVVERAEGNLAFNPRIGDENSLQAELLVHPIKSGLIYLAQCVNWGEFLKIGYATDWFSRQSSLQTGSPETIRLRAFAKLPDGTELRVYEEQFHRILWNVRHPLGREFFKADAETFEMVARKLKSPFVRRITRGAEGSDSDVSLVEELKDTEP
jgi:Meiotically up-regulated gene 113